MTVRGEKYVERLFEVVFLLLWGGGGGLKASLAKEDD